MSSGRAFVIKYPQGAGSCFWGKRSQGRQEGEGGGWCLWEPWALTAEGRSTDGSPVCHLLGLSSERLNGTRKLPLSPNLWWLLGAFPVLSSELLSANDTSGVIWALRAQGRARPGGAHLRGQGKDARFLSRRKEEARGMKLHDGGISLKGFAPFLAPFGPAVAWLCS